MQISPLEAIKQADEVIHNELGLKNLYGAVTALDKKYRLLFTAPENSLDEQTFLRYYLAFK